MLHGMEVRLPELCSAPMRSVATAKYNPTRKCRRLFEFTVLLTFFHSVQCLLYLLPVLPRF